VYPTWAERWSVSAGERLRTGVNETETETRAWAAGAPPAGPPTCRAMPTQINQIGGGQVGRADRHDAVAEQALSLFGMRHHGAGRLRSGAPAGGQSGRCWHVMHSIVLSALSAMVRTACACQSASG
jgi:hypothetical protein